MTKQYTKDEINRIHSTLIDMHIDGNLRKPFKTEVVRKALETQPPIEEQQVKDAIIYSAKHMGAWSDRMSDDVMEGRITKLYLDLPSLISALTDGVQNQ